MSICPLKRACGRPATTQTARDAVKDSAHPHLYKLFGGEPPKRSSATRAPLKPELAGARLLVTRYDDVTGLPSRGNTQKDLLLRLYLFAQIDGFFRRRHRLLVDFQDNVAALQ